jgi:RNA recognition motif-containing protein
MLVFSSRGITLRRHSRKLALRDIANLAVWNSPGKECLRETRKSRLIGAQMQNRLYVGNLAGDVAASTLQELFEPHGFVMDVKLVACDKAGHALAFALVTMAKDESARSAMKALNGASLHGVAITVEVAQEAESYSPTGSRGGA